jgi:hypothetical protein
MFLEGGTINQDHFAADPFNLGVLEGRGPRDVFVLARDPRAAARSQVRYLAPGTVDAGGPLEAMIERECVGNFIPWLERWLALAADPHQPLRVHFITYREAAGDMAAVLRRIACTLASEHPALAAYADRQSLPEVRIHYQDGNDEMWRRDVGGIARSRMWDACSAEIKELLDLKW